MAASGQQWVERVWYGDSWAFLPLVPLAWLYAAAVAVRRRLYRLGVLRATRIGVPVVVIGNITAGGTGKTPATIWLANALRKRGHRPGVVSRGYRGAIGRSPRVVTPASDPRVVGDEPVLIARRTRCPVAVHPDRVAAARLLVEDGVDIVLADDGLQHYALARDYEIAIVDGERGWGNGRPLPAGPLREPVSRLAEVQRVLVNSSGDDRPLDGLDVTAVGRFELEARTLSRLDDSETRPLGELAGSRVHAVAAIGHPRRFFDTLARAGIEVVAHPLPDHAAIDARDVTFADDDPVLMTEKDAVKCRHLPPDDLWYVPVDVSMHDAAWLTEIEGLIGKRGDIDHG